MDDPYYSSAPTVLLRQPVVLVGPPGARVPLTGAMLATLTGLPLVDLDRALAHEAGRSLSRLWTELGRGAVAALEARILERVLRETPAPIVVLGHDTLDDPTCRQLVLQRSMLVVLYREGAVRRDPSRRPVAAAPEDAVVAQKWLGLPGEIIDATDLHPHRVAAMLLSRLPAQ